MSYKKQQEQDFFFKGFNSSVGKLAQREELRRIQKTFSLRDRQNQLPIGYSSHSGSKRRYTRQSPKDQYSTTPTIRRRSRSLPTILTSRRSQDREEQVANADTGNSKINPMIKFIHTNTGINLNSNIHFGLLIGGAIAVALISTILVYKKMTTKDVPDANDGGDAAHTDTNNTSNVRSPSEPTISHQRLSLTSSTSPSSSSSSSNSTNDALIKMIKDVDDVRRRNVAHSVVAEDRSITMHDSIIVVLTVLGDDKDYISSVASRIDHAFKYASIPNRVDFLIIHHTNDVVQGGVASILEAYDLLNPAINFKSRIVVRLISEDEAMGCLHARNIALHTLNAISSMKEKIEMQHQSSTTVETSSTTEFVLWIGKADQTLLVKSWDYHCVSQWKKATRASAKDELIGSHGEIDPGRKLNMPKNVSGMRREVIVTCLPPSMKDSCRKLQSVYDSERYTSPSEEGSGTNLRGGRIVTKSFLVENPTHCPGTWQSFHRWQDEFVERGNDGRDGEAISIPIASSEVRFFSNSSLSNHSKRSIRFDHGGEDESTKGFPYDATDDDDDDTSSSYSDDAAGRPVMTPWYCGQFAFGRIVSFKAVPFDPLLAHLSLKETDAIHAIRWWCSHGILYNPSHILCVNVPSSRKTSPSSSSSSSPNVKHVQNYHNVKRDSLRVIGKYHAALKNQTSFDDSRDHHSSPLPNGKIHYPRRTWLMFRFPELYADFARLSGVDWRQNAVTIHGRMGIVRYRPLFMKERDILLKYDNSSEYEKRKKRD